MYELVYGSSEVQSTIKKEFPNAIFKDASDEVHPERFEVTFSDDSEEFEDRFYVFAIKEGFADLCFGFQLLIRHSDPTEKQKTKLNRILKEIEKSKMTLLELAKQYESDVETRIACIKENWDNADDTVHLSEECVDDYERQIAHWEATLDTVGLSIEEQLSELDMQIYEYQKKINGLLDTIFLTDETHGEETTRILREGLYK